MKMKIFKEDKESGMSCGINNDGELFCGDDKSGYNLPNTPENRSKVISDFYYYTDKSVHC